MCTEQSANLIGGDRTATSLPAKRNDRLLSNASTREQQQIKIHSNRKSLHTFLIRNGWYSSGNWTCELIAIPGCHGEHGFHGNIGWDRLAFSHVSMEIVATLVGLTVVRDIGGC